jgi:hypothetical protein
MFNLSYSNILYIFIVKRRLIFVGKEYPNLPVILAGLLFVDYIKNYLAGKTDVAGGKIGSFFTLTFSFPAKKVIFPAFPMRPIQP